MQGRNKLVSAELLIGYSYIKISNFHDKPVYLGCIKARRLMEKSYFPLGNSDDNRIVKILRITFGVACIIMSIWWLFYTLNAEKSYWSIWITILFLAGFGFYQIWAGAGKATRFIMVAADMLTIKKNAMLPPVKISTANISKIDIYPLSIVFHQKDGKKFLLRFGTINYETNEKIVDELIRYAEENTISYEVKEEEL